MKPMPESCGDHVGRALFPWYGYVHIGVPINMLCVLEFWAQ